MKDFFMIFPMWLSFSVGSLVLIALVKLIMFVRNIMIESLRNREKGDKSL